MYTYLRVHLHIIPPISPPQVDNGPADSYCCSAGKLNRGQTWVRCRQPVESAFSKKRRKGSETTAFVSESADAVQW